MPNGGYDGSIRIKVDAETDRAMTKIQNLEAKLRRQTEAMDRQANRVSDLKAKYDKLASGDVMPRSLGAMERKLQDAQREAAALETKMQELGTQQEFALGVGDTGRSKALELEIERLGQQLITAEDAAAKLRGEIDAIKMNPASSEEAQKVKRDFEAAERTLVRMRDESARTGEALRRTITIQAEETGKKLQTLSQRAKTARDSVQSMGKASKGLGILSGKLGDILNRLKNIAISALVMSAAYKGFRALADYLSGAVKANREFSASLAQVKGNLLTAFQPIYNAIMPTLNALMSAVARATAYIAAFVNMLFGKSVSASAAGAKSLYAQAKGFGAASKAAKEAGKSFAAFDEINQLIIDEAEGGGGGGVEMPEFGDTADMSGLLGLLEKLKGVIQEIADIFMTGFWEGFGEFDFARLNTDLKSIGKTLLDIFLDPEVQRAGRRLAESIIKNLGRVVGSAASIGLSIVQALVGGIEEELANRSEDIKGWIVRMFDISEDIADISGGFCVALATIAESLRSEPAQGIIAALLDTFGTAVSGASEILLGLGRDALNLIAQPIIDNQEEFKTAFENTFKALEPIAQGFAEIIDGAFSGIRDAYYEHVKPTLDEIATGLSEIVNQVLGYWNEWIAPVLQDIGDRFKMVSENYVAPAFNRIGEVVGKIAELVREFWNDCLKPLISFLVDVLTLVVTTVVDYVGGLVNSFFQMFGGIFDGIMDILSGLIDFLGGLFTGDWERVWEGLKEIATGALNALISVFEGVINGIIDGINAVIGLINNVTGTVGDAIGVNLKIPKIGAVDLPRLASGAVIPPRQEFMAILGDQRSGTNIEAPLSTIEDAVRAVLAEQEGGQQQDITINFTGNMAQLARALKPHLDAESMRRGTSLVMGVS